MQYDFKTIYKYLIIAGIIIIIDQLSKKILLASLVNTKDHSIIINKIINLRIMWNRGVVFGFLNYGTIKTIPLIICTTILLVFLILSILTRYNYLIKSMVIGGGTSNLLDRIQYGAVLDFIDIHIGVLHYPTLNLADIFVMLGLSCIMYYDFFKK